MLAAGLTSVGLLTQARESLRGLGILKIVLVIQFETTLLLVFSYVLLIFCLCSLYA